MQSPLEDRLTAQEPHDDMLALVLAVAALANEGMATGDTRDALNEIKWKVKDFLAALTEDKTHG